MVTRLGGASRLRGSGSSGAGSGLRRGRPSGGLPGVRWFMARLAAALAAVLIVVTTAGFLLSRQASGTPASWARSSGSDAVWVSGGVSSVPSSVRYVNVYAGQFSSSGAFTPAADASSLARSLRGHVVLAWVTGAVGVGQLSLDSVSVRASVVSVSRGLLRSGFSGLSLDLGPVASGDTGLLTLLSALRALRPSVLDVMTPKLEPLTGMTIPASLMLGHPVFWTGAYLSRVAALATQVTVLAYSTGLPFPSWYSGYVSHETRAAVSAVAGTGASLLIGVPAFTESTTGHHGSAETVGSALAGVRAGLTRSGHVKFPFGVGLVVPPPGTAGFVPAPSSANWSDYRSGWLSPAA